MERGLPTKALWDRLPEIVRFRDQPGMTETYSFAGAEGTTELEGQLFRQRARPSKAVYLFMHPTATAQLLPMPEALADAGLHVLCASSRYPRNDSALIMEKVAYDMGQWVRHARESLGYEKVILVGWSGGGSLSLFYAAQSEHPTITHTPAGDLYDLTAARLQRVDGIVLIAAHLSRAEVLTEWLDPSVIDEFDPDTRDLEFDIYSPDCPNKPPFTADFIAAFRERQRARNRRITAWAEEMLATLRRRNDGETERAFVTHRTMCDVRWIDPTIDPNGRAPGASYLGNPRTVNVGPAGLARFSTLRSWLSQWSYDLSNSKAAVNATKIHRTPVLQIENEADDAVPASHNPIIHNALTVANKEFVSIKGATHFYQGQPEHLSACIDGIIDWSHRNDL